MDFESQEKNENFVLRLGDKAKKISSGEEGEIIALDRRSNTVKFKNTHGNKIQLCKLEDFEPVSYGLEGLNKEKENNVDLDSFFNLLLKNSSTEKRIEKNKKLIDVLSEMDVGTSDLDELQRYLRLQRSVEDKFKKMVAHKKGENFDNENYVESKKEWEDAKGSLKEFMPSSDLLELNPQEITADTPGKSVNKIIRKANLGALSENEREGLLDTLESYFYVIKKSELNEPENENEEAKKAA